MDKFKVVTIRGISESYYSQFTSLTKLLGRSAGSAFSELIKHYKKPTPAILGTSKIKQMFLESFNVNAEYLEVVENLEELVLSKKLLEEAGTNVKFLFHNIKNLVLDQSIDNDVILNHVYRMTNSKVIVKGNLSKLIFYSLLRYPSQKRKKTDDLRDITIRNVNTESYDEFISNCQLHGQSIGEGVNDLFAEFVPEAELMFIVINELNTKFKDLLVITSLDSVHITENDLIEVKNKRVLFHRIQDLKIDLGSESFLEKIIGIYNCGKVEIHEEIPQLLKLSRIKKFPKG